MTGEKVTNIAASVHRRLLNRARDEGRPFNEVLQYFAMERFLYRLAISPHAERFVLKGALMLIAWRAPVLRPTMDIDLLGRLDNRVPTLVAVVREVCQQPVEPLDGLVFEPTSVDGTRIREDAAYAGVRVRLSGRLGNARLRIQLDVGFGDVVLPAPTLIEYPTVLAFPAPRLHGYSRESAIAEKFEAMTALGMLTSRLKDFHDIWLLSTAFPFEGAVLGEAVRRTFARRGTSLHAEPVALSTTFAHDLAKQMQWRAFIRRGRLGDAPTDLATVVGRLNGFLGPIARALVNEQAIDWLWRPAGPWAPR
jgi:hypothetical protein